MMRMAVQEGRGEQPAAAARRHHRLPHVSARKRLPLLRNAAATSEGSSDP